MGFSAIFSQQAASDRLQSQVRDQAERLFEPRLQELGLARDQIEKQTLPELEQSLERVNEALAHPEQFGILRLKVTASAGVLVTTGNQEAHFELGILPILLERKRLILDRIRLLRGEQDIATMRELVKGVPQDDIRTAIIGRLNGLESDSKRIQEQLHDVESKREQLSAREESDRAKLAVELWERRSRVLQTFLEKESVATILGGVILLLLTLVFIVATFTGVTVSQILDNMLLLVLGYFFGQTVSRTGTSIVSSSETREGS